MLTIVVDSREAALLPVLQSLCLNKQINVISRQLSIGDVLIEHSATSQTIVLYERKTHNDLLASVKDQRYYEQAYRLSHHTLHNHNIVYIIEGDMTTLIKKRSRPATTGKKCASLGGKLMLTLDVPVSTTATTTGAATTKTIETNDPDEVTIPPVMQTLYSAMTSLQFYKGHSVTRTKDVTDTAYTIYCTTVKIMREIKKGERSFFYKEKEPCIEFNTKEEKEGEEKEEEKEKEAKEEEKESFAEPNTKKQATTTLSSNSYSECAVKMVKRDNIDATNIHEIMLLQIPGLSATSARAILHHGPGSDGTLATLLQNMRNNREWLHDVAVSGKAGNRRIAVKTIDLLYRLMC